MHRMTVSFGDNEFSGLQELARRADRSHAWVVRYAVRELLERLRAGQLELPLLGSELREPATSEPA
ncbi:MAG: CopG family transcriptional regulator [Gemmatimonadota bacterium]